jgi:transcriptional repressor NrdR
MKCPFCRRDNDRVIDSRACEDGFAIRRRRHCQNCDRRYTTYERIAEVDIKVVKRNGMREVFLTDKIRNGLKRACWKRPVTTEQLESLIAKVEQEVVSKFESENEITSAELGRIVMHQLFELDQVAYVRFASVYRQFSGAQDFVSEVQQVLRKHSN